MPTEFPDWRWPNFTPEEMACRETGALVIHPGFMDRLQRLRTELGFTFPVTSGYRSAKHSVERRKPRPGAHVLGRAVDIAVRGEEAFRLVAAAPAFGFTGLGIAQRGGSRFIHLDDMRAEEYHAPRPAIWSY
jgi:uncharacterized protein YcbK (DUF882 family)